MNSIPEPNEATPESFQERIPGLNRGLYCLLVSTCVALLVQATTLKHPQTKSLKSVLPALHKVLIAKKGECVSYMTKKQILNIQREAQAYKSKCEQLIETLTSESAQSVDILRSLFKDDYR